jgi:hypothetical protein
MTIDEFQQIILNEHNKYRRQMCANDLQDEDDLHEKAIKRAHDRANGLATPLPDDCNENDFELETGDPSKITGENLIYLFAYFIYNIFRCNDRQRLV